MLLIPVNRPACHVLLANMWHDRHWWTRENEPAISLKFTWVVGAAIWIPRLRLLGAGGGLASEPCVRGPGRRVPDLLQRCLHCCLHRSYVVIIYHPVVELVHEDVLGGDGGVFAREAETDPKSKHQPSQRGARHSTPLVTPGAGSYSRENRK